MADVIPEEVLDELQDLEYDVSQLEAAAHSDDGCCSGLIRSNLSLYQQSYNMLQQVNLKINFFYIPSFNPSDYLFSSQTDPDDGSLIYLEQVLRALVLASHWVASLLSSQCCCARRGQQFDPSRPGSLAFWRLRVESHILLAQGK